MFFNKLRNLDVADLRILSEHLKGGVAYTDQHILEIHSGYAPDFIKIEQFEEESQLFFKGSLYRHHGNAREQL